LGRTFRRFILRETGVIKVLSWDFV
jgi:hypothetical protein